MTRYEPGDPREWINRARCNLAIAGCNEPGIYLEELCYNAQQAAEKAVKAVGQDRRQAGWIFFRSQLGHKLGVHRGVKAAYTRLAD